MGPRTWEAGAYVLLEIHKSLGLQAQPAYLRACRNCGRVTEGETTGAHTAQQAWILGQLSLSSSPYR